MPGDARRTQPVAVRVSDHPLAECNALYKIVPDVADEGWFRYQTADQRRHLYRYSPKKQWGGVQYAYSVPLSSWVLNDAFTPRSCEADSSIAAADALPIGRHVWRYADGGVWKQSSVRTSRVEQWIVLDKSPARSGKDSGSAKLGVFQKREVLGVLGDPVYNRDNVLVVQTITLPQKMSPELGVRGVWVDVQAKPTKKGKDGKTFLRKMGAQ